MILVTGAGGFLGTALAAHLCDQRLNVRAVVRNESHIPLLPSDIEIVVADIRDQGKIRKAATGCETIVHLAAKVHAFHETGSDPEYYAVNVEGTRNLLEGARAAGVKRLLFISSVKVFGEETRGCIDETHPPGPLTPYGQSKWRAEQLVAEYGQQEHMQVLSLRLPMVYGPTIKGNLYRMIKAIDRGWFPPLPQVPTRRSMLHVKNFVYAIEACLAFHEYRQASYIVADAQPYSTTDMYELIRVGLGKPLPAWRVPLAVLKATAKAGDVVEAIVRRPVPFTSQTLQKLIGPACYSAAALMRDMRYDPAYSFESAVPELIEHYRRTSVSPC
ncbi:MAG: NAD-dependent epimerase/dehydratase family protein [Nitrospiraceae bacterium]|nr:NAD-dependent epimerase/dehydratase family protein [Nitrospiraceae bacterium]